MKREKQTNQATDETSKKESIVNEKLIKKTNNKTICR